MRETTSPSALRAPRARSTVLCETSYSWASDLIDGIRPDSSPELIRAFRILASCSCSGTGVPLSTMGDTVTSPWSDVDFGGSAWFHGVPLATLPPVNLSALDVILADLRARYPDWHIWYVPHAADGMVTWCAQPLPLINTDSPEHLRQEIEAASREAGVS